MKVSYPFKSIGCILSGAIGLMLTLPQPAQALSLVYETGASTGQAFTGGQISIKFSGFGTGSAYDFAGTPVAGSGFGANVAGTVVSGISALNPLSIQAPVNASNVQTVINGIPQGAGSVSAEDFWSIARVTEIVDFATGDTIWSQAVKGTQITGLVSGGKDFYYDFNGGTNRATVDAVGVRLDLFEVTTLGFPNANSYNATTGPGVGHAGDTLGDGSLYAGTTNGAPILSIRSTAGFLHNDGVLGGFKTEFESSLNLSGSGGNGNLGSGFFNVIGGSEAAFFDNNGIESGIQAGLFSDIQLEFTETTFGTNPDGTLKSNPFGWIAATNDPVTAIFQTPTIPEPGTALAGTICAMLVGITRRRKRATA